MNLIKLSLLAILTILCVNVSAQNITISGQDITTVTLGKAEIMALKPVIVMAKGHDQKVHRYAGAALADVLKRAGVTLGDSSKRKTILSYIVVTAADNYKAIYALSEIDPLFANRTIILAYKVDKKALPENDAPFQIIVAGEKIHSRWVRQVSAIELVTAK
ncbi:molybdopterin-dependent oxidoreductase [uncultured Mucilaginibacter sp.]|uniref:molybdopterin-dependent oxidoreductase n=1 Tax=uncultured Mucilaginibacter sp. TaxID=797541 RepID=UPI0025D121C6|nr:molybdopterin-dependent oxidoreductase [uncultured Mucilaginibacter sp.]